MGHPFLYVIKMYIDVLSYVHIEVKWATSKFLQFNSQAKILNSAAGFQWTSATSWAPGDSPRPCGHCHEIIENDTVIGEKNGETWYVTRTHGWNQKQNTSAKKHLRQRWHRTCYDDKFSLVSFSRHELGSNLAKTWHLACFGDSGWRRWCEGQIRCLRFESIFESNCSFLVF